MTEQSWKYPLLIFSTPHKHCLLEEYKNILIRVGKTIYQEEELPCRKDGITLAYYQVGVDNIEDLFSDFPLLKRWMFKLTQKIKKIITWFQSKILSIPLYTNTVYTPDNMYLYYREGLLHRIFTHKDDVILFFGKEEKEPVKEPEIMIVVEEKHEHKHQFN